MESPKKEVLYGTRIEQDFSLCLKEALERKSMFGEDEHVYLTHLFMKYVYWEGGSFSPGINSRTTEPFIFQLENANSGIFREDDSFIFADNSSLRYERLRTIGDTLLLAVGYWPESISSIEVIVGENTKVLKGRPPLNYYANIGEQAYQDAANSAYESRFETTVARLMANLSKGFRRFAAAVYDVRQELGSGPVKNISILSNLAYVFGDDTPFRHYMIKGLEGG